MITELITGGNFSENSLDDFVRTQYVKRIYRKKAFGYGIEEAEFIMDWDIEKKREVARDMMSDETIAYACRQGGKIVGFVSVLRELVEGFMVLDLIQVDGNKRREGLGRKLFNLALNEADKAKAKGLYISACPSEETVRFYFAMGCEIADKPIRKFAEEEPDDVQMVYLFRILPGLNGWNNAPFLDKKEK